MYNTIKKPKHVNEFRSVSMVIIDCLHDGIAGGGVSFETTWLQCPIMDLLKAQVQI